MAVTLTIDGTSLRASIRNLGKVSDEELNRASKLALKAAGMDLRAALHKNVKLTDHSLEALAAMDHPYARRHGTIQIHSDRPYVVHKRSGAMAGSITGRLVRSGGVKNYSYRVGFDYGAVRHARFVVEGTTKMLPRNVVLGTSQQPEVRKAMMKSVVRVLGKELRTGAAIRF